MNSDPIEGQDHEVVVPTATDDTTESESTVATGHVVAAPRY